MTEHSSTLPYGRIWGFRWLQRIFGGTMFEGARDLYATFGYNQNPTFENYLFKYLRQDIAKRVINAPVSATWADPPTVQADPTFMAAWQDLLAGHRIWYKLSKLDRLVGLGRYAIMVVGIDDGRALDSPVAQVRSNSPTRRILYLQPYMEMSVKIKSFDENKQSARFGQPAEYEITPVDEARQSALEASHGATKIKTQDTFNVHWSRVLHVADNTLENEVFGSSRLESIYNVLDDMLKVVGGGAETYWLTANRGLQADVDKEMDLKPEDETNLETEVEEYFHNLRRIIRTRGVKMTPLGSEMADPSNIFDVLCSLVSASTGIPKRMLIGSEAGQLASQQDRGSWAERIAERVSEYAEPVVLLPFIAMMIRTGVLPAPSTLTINWPEAFKLSPIERGQTAAQMARSIANITKMFSQPIDAIEMTEETEVSAAPEPPARAGAGAPEDEEEGGPPPNINQIPGEEEIDGSEPTLPTEDGMQRTGRKKVIKKWLEGGRHLFSPEEGRQIVGFGKHMPVFDSKRDSSQDPKQPDTEQQPQTPPPSTPKPEIPELEGSS